MLDGVLARATVCRTAAGVLALELGLVFVLVASDYRAFNYAVHVRQVDAVQRPDIEALWDDVRAKLEQVRGSNATVRIPVAEPALHLSTGILSSRVLIAPELEDALRGAWEQVIDWHIDIETVDSLVLIYLFLAVVYAGLYINTTHLLQAGGDSDDVFDKPVQLAARGDVAILDVMFWVLRLALLVAVQKMCNLLGVDALIGWAAAMYVVLMYVLCQPTTAPQPVVLAAGLAWTAHFMLMLISSGMSILAGLAFVIVHLGSMCSVFVHVTDAPVSLGKFVNTRFWDHVLASTVLFMLYAVSVIYVPAPRRVFVSAP